MFLKVGRVFEVFRRTSCGFCLSCIVAGKSDGEKYIADSAEVKQAANSGSCQQKQSKWRGDERSRSCRWVMLWSET